MYPHQGVPRGLAASPSPMQEEESALIDNIDKDEWVLDLGRRTQQRGKRFDYSSQMLQDLDRPQDVLPAYYQTVVERLTARFPDLWQASPNQSIVNEYLPGQGINPHIDKAELFGDVVCALTLCGSAGMVFDPLTPGLGKSIGLLLEPRGLLIMSSDARFRWRHGIPKVYVDMGADGKEWPRSRRVSLTLRTLRKTDEPPARRSAFAVSAYAAVARMVAASRMGEVAHADPIGEEAGEEESPPQIAWHDSHDMPKDAPRRPSLADLLRAKQAPQPTKPVVGTEPGALTPAADTNADPLTNQQTAANANADPVTSQQTAADTNADPVTSQQTAANTNADPVTSQQTAANANADPVTSPQTAANTSADPVTSPQIAANTNADPLTSPQIAANTNADPVTSQQTAANTNADPVASPQSTEKAYTESLT